MPYMINSWSIVDGASLSVSKSKLVCRSLIFVDHKLALVYLLGPNIIRISNNSFCP